MPPTEDEKFWTEIRSNGVKMADIRPRWYKLLILAEKINPKLHDNMMRGMFDPADDMGTVKLKLIEGIVNI